MGTHCSNGAAAGSPLGRQALSSTQLTGSEYTQLNGVSRAHARCHSSQQICWGARDYLGVYSFRHGLALWLARHHSSRRNAHCGSRQTRHVLGSPQASRGCTRAAATRAGFTARSLRYSGQCAHYASVHTPSQHVLPARSSLGTYSSARARTPHSWLRSNTVLACIWLDAGAMRATSDRTHGPCCWRCVAVSDGSWFGAGHLMARPPMQYAPRPLVAHRNLGIRLARSRRRTIHRTHASKTTRAIFAGARCSLGVRVVRSWHYTRARRQQHACHVC